MEPELTQEKEHHLPNLRYCEGFLNSGSLKSGTCRNYVRRAVVLVL